MPEGIIVCVVGQGCQTQSGDSVWRREIPELDLEQGVPEHNLSQTGVLGVKSKQYKHRCRISAENYK